MIKVLRCKKRQLVGNMFLSGQILQQPTIDLDFL